MEVPCTAEVTATGGRKNGHASSDGAIDVHVNPPKEMGGSGEGTYPEQLSAGYAACFDDAIASVVRREQLQLGKRASGDDSVGRPAPRSGGC
jgi:lipoyl-dependent peroxiredoxin